MIDAQTRAEATRGDPVSLLRHLVSVPSVNPTLAPGGDGEGAVAELAAAWLRAWGFDVRLDEVAPGRSNVVAEHGSGSPRLLFNGHLDTVGVDGMTIDPFGAELREGRVWGRGSCDMKGGVASLLAAAAELARAGHPGTLLVILTADEEHASLGMQRVVRDGRVADAAVVCEPTDLAVMPRTTASAPSAAMAASRPRTSAESSGTSVPGRARPGATVISRPGAVARTGSARRSKSPSTASTGSPGSVRRSSTRSQRSG